MPKDEQQFLKDSGGVLFGLIGATFFVIGLLMYIKSLSPHIVKYIG